jgi:hypothetical protein
MYVVSVMFSSATSGRHFVPVFDGPAHQDNEQFWWFFSNFKKVGFLKSQISKILWMVCTTKQRRKIRSHSDPRMKLSISEAKIMNSFVDFFKFYKGRFFKNLNFKNIFNFEMENLRKLVFIHIKLKLLTKASISCLSHPFMSITTWFMSVFAIGCLRKIVRFFIFTGL